MTNSLALRIAALFGALAVALGAFGAHALKESLNTNGMLATWDKAVLYHFIHAVMLFVLATRTPFLRVPWFFFLAGILLFSGSLYLYSLTLDRWLMYLTPFGGTSFVIGWIWMAVCPSSTDRK